MIHADMIRAPNLLTLPWLDHGFGLRDSVPPSDVRTIKQIHSGVVLNAAELPPACEGDALISNEPGVRVGVKTADCVPVLLVDPTLRAVAAIHAGWRGTAQNIAAAAVREMAARWNARPENLRAAIGPSIGVCCYEVGPEVARHFGKWNTEMEHVHEHVHLDLPSVNERQLRALGVNDIWKSGECTFCRADKFFSFRREREAAGRLMSFVGLR